MGVTSKARMSILPQFRTMAESGLLDYEVCNWLYLLAPAGTPKDVLATPALKQQLIGLGVEPTFGPSNDFALLIRTELPKWAALVKKSGAIAD